MFYVDKMYQGQLDLDLFLKPQQRSNYLFLTHSQDHFICCFDRFLLTKSVNIERQFLVTTRDFQETIAHIYHWCTGYGILTVCLVW